MNFSNMKRLFSLIAVFALLATLFTGCFGSSDAEETSEDTTPVLNMADETEPSTEETTLPTETTAVNENLATVTSDMNVRSSPSTEANVVGTLKAGDTVEVVRQEKLLGIWWGKLAEPDGWVCMDFVEMLYTDPSTDSDTSTPAGNDDPDATVTETTAPADNDDNDQNNNDDDKTDTNSNGNGSTTVIAKGIVKAGELNIRSAATTDSDRVGGLTYGDRVEIYEKSGSWGRIDEGWIHLDYIYQDGTTGANSTGGIVTGDGLNIRSGPGTGYASVGSYNSGDRVTILEQFKYNGVTWGCTNKGWISMAYVYVDGTDVGDTEYGTVNADDLNIRSGPGTGYASVGKLDTGDDVEIYYRVTVGDTAWGCIDEGWICLDYVDLG